MAGVVAVLGVPAWSTGWLLAYLAQTAAMIVFALSCNLLLGHTGLLSFGHATCSGLGGLLAAQVFNRLGVPLPLLPLVGGLGGALAGVVVGVIATRQAGTVFAMITLGLGELVAAAAWTLPGWFGGEAGVSIDRAHGVPWGSWTFAPARQAYVVIVLWCGAASLAMWFLTRTPFMRQANAVRDNPLRVAALGGSPRRIRFGVVVLASFFAGIAGTLGLINVELVSAESVSLLRSGAVLFAVVIGGTSSFFGPVVGAIVLTGFSLALASLTLAWPFYLGLLFIVVVMASPDGMTGFVGRQVTHWRRYGWQACMIPTALGAGAVLAWSGAVIVLLQWVYDVAFDLDGTAAPMAGRHALALVMAPVALLAASGWLAARSASRRWAGLAAIAAATHSSLSPRARTTASGSASGVARRGPP
ncbi:branched-chain amino acid ABC transporter permease [Paraburkholderia hayleyella]|uniref:branched-chain amino acid ABC transporter permease n=1 Tax=Paraburkholderia hayleyella TaxID=2152889 RepID=UPI001290A74D|nr:branched-chain amino acid ABC transporter permease [Paraburkholderia hayleyella]